MLNNLKYSIGLEFKKFFKLTQLLTHFKNLEDKDQSIKHLNSEVNIFFSQWNLNINNKEEIDLNVKQMSLPLNEIYILKKTKEQIYKNITDILLKIKDKEEVKYGIFEIAITNIKLYNVKVNFKINTENKTINISELVCINCKNPYDYTKEYNEIKNIFNLITLN